MATFKTPVKKKSRKGQKLYIPLPIPIGSKTEEGAKLKWCYYHGKMVEDHVVIEKSGDVVDLTQHGCFGKLHIWSSTHKTKDKAKVEDLVDEGATSSQKHMETMSKSTLPLCDEILQIDMHSDFSSDKLHLDLFESFFLSYGTGCLFVERNNTSMSIPEQWSYSSAKSSWFPIHYAVYHHFRTKGWVPKDGIRYGADFLLYRKGPPYFHASYIVVIRCIDAESLKPVHFNEKEERKFSWETLTGLLRLATTVSKEIMFCYVAIPKEISSLNDIFPDNLKHLTIYENIVSRWVSSKDREKELLDVDCDY